MSSGRNKRTPKPSHAGSVVSALAVGALAVGTSAVGMVAIGRLIVGRLRLNDTKPKPLKIDELRVRFIKLETTDEQQPPR